MVIITGKNYGDHDVSNSFIFDHWLDGHYCHLVDSSIISELGRVENSPAYDRDTIK